MVTTHLCAARKQTPVGRAAPSEGQPKTLCEGWLWGMIREPTRGTSGGGEASDRKDLKKPESTLKPNIWQFLVQKIVLRRIQSAAAR